MNIRINTQRQLGLFKNLELVAGEIDFDSSYASGGEDLALDNYFSSVFYCAVEPTSGYVFDYDKTNDTVRVLAGGEGGKEEIPLNADLAVVDDDSPGGNQVQLAFTNAGIPYFEANMAGDTSDKYLQFGTGGPHIKIFHNGTPTSQGVSVDDDGEHPDRLISDLSGVMDTDVYVPCLEPGYFVKVVNASSGGTALNYDDGADEQLESTTAGDADTAIRAMRFVGGSIEMPTATDLSALSGVRFMAAGIRD